MTIWILALICLGACMALGHKLGAINAAITFIGIPIAALLAVPLGGLIHPLLPHLGVHNPIYAWLLPPLIVFVILMMMIKSIGFFVHRKVFVHYKHYTDDTQLAFWERMNHRVGLCVGALNGFSYLVLISLIIYNLSYWTTQVASSDDEKFTVKILNRAGHDLEGTGMIKVARAIDPMPEMYFKLADLAGLLYQNPQLKDRLSDYPPFLALDEQQDFQKLGSDADFQSAWQNHSRLGELLNNGSALAIWQNKSTADMLLNLVKSNLDDLQAYLKTGQSAKYDSEPILGRWHFNVVSTIAMMSQTKQNVSSADMRALRALWTPAYAKTTFIAASDGEAFLKNVPHFKMEPNQPTTYEAASFAGKWNNDGGTYDITVANGNQQKSGTGKISGARLTLNLDGELMIFDR